MGKKFIESFVQECYKQGLTELQAWGALSTTLEKQAGFKLDYQQMKDDPRYEVTPMKPDDVDLIKDPEGWLRFWKRLIQNGYYRITGQSDKMRTPVTVNDTRMTPNYLIEHGESAMARARQDLIRATRLKYRVNGEVKDNPAYAGVSVQQLALTQRARSLQMRKEDAAAQRDKLLAEITERQSLYSKNKDDARYQTLEMHKKHVEKLYNDDIKAIDRELRDLRAVVDGTEDSVTVPHKYALNDPEAVQGAAERARNKELRDKGFFDAVWNLDMLDYLVAVHNREKDEEADRIHARQVRQLEDAALEERKAIRFRREGLSAEQAAQAAAEIDKALQTGHPVTKPADAAAPVTSPIQPKSAVEDAAPAAAPAAEPVTTTPEVQTPSTTASDVPKGGTTTPSESTAPASPQSPGEDEEEEVIEDSTTPS